MPILQRGCLQLRQEVLRNGKPGVLCRVRVDSKFFARGGQRVHVFVDIPWPKDLCFLDTGHVCDEARRLVEQTARRGRRHPCVLAYSIGNEIPPNIVRWHGARRVERFLAELYDVGEW